jgi:uncharacterized protein (DUF1015 family)
MPGVTADPAIENSGGLVLAPFRGVRFAVDRVRDLGAVTSPPYDLVDDDGVGGLMARNPYNVVRLILPRDVVAGTPVDRGPAPGGDGHGPAAGEDGHGPAAGEDGTEPRDGRYGHAGETLRRWLADGVLVTDSTPALYVHEQRGSGTLQRGLIGGLGLDEESARAVLPHEDVFPGPIQDRLRLMRATGANLEPIFLLYEGDGAASDLVDEVAAEEPPIVETATDDGLTHRLWRIDDQRRLAGIGADLRGRQALIADGHHRYATYQRLRAEYSGPGPWDYGLALLVDSRRYPPRLDAIHRVLPGLPVTVAARRAAAAFRVEEVAGGRPGGDAARTPPGATGTPSEGTPGAFPGTDTGAPPETDGELDAALEILAARGHGGTAFLLAGNGPTVLVSDPDPALLDEAMPPGTSPLWRRLDTSVLHQLLIRDVWGIEEGEGTVRVVHHSPHAAVAKARRTGGTAVIVNPLETDDVLAVAAGGERVPRKSTSFGPKPRTGLIMRTFATG